MRKFFVYCILPILLITVSGCTNTPSEDVQFSLFTRTAPISDIRYNLEDDNTLIQAHRGPKQEQSLLIIAEDISDEKSLRDVVDQNKATLMRSYPSLNFLDEGESTIVCEDTGSYFLVFDTNNNEEDREDPLYFVQYLYIYDSTVYLISNAITDHSLTNSLLDSLDTIDCTI